MDALLGWSTLVMALATVGIFLFTWLNYRMYVRMKEGNEEQQRRFNDLLEAIVIATILSGPSSWGQFTEAKTKFLREYKGHTQVFKS